MDDKKNVNEMPLSIKHVLFKNNIIKVINESGLPGWAVEDIMTNILEQLRKINANQLAQDQKQYEEQLKASEENNDNDEENSVEEAEEEHPVMNGEE